MVFYSNDNIGYETKCNTRFTRRFIYANDYVPIYERIDSINAKRKHIAISFQYSIHFHVCSSSHQTIPMDWNGYCYVILTAIPPRIQHANARFVHITRLVVVVVVADAQNRCPKEYNDWRKGIPFIFSMENVSNAPRMWRWRHLKALPFHWQPLARNHRQYRVW